MIEESQLKNERSNSPYCLVCGHTNYSTIHRLDHWNILQCSRCGLIFVNPQPSLQSLIESAEKTHSGFGDQLVGNYHRSRNLCDGKDPLIKSHVGILRLIEKSTSGRKLLDIGCGEGTFSAIATQRGWQVKALDVSSAATQAAKKEYGLDTITSGFPSADLDEHAFDAIVMLDFLEHIPNPVEALSSARKLLHRGGVLYINSPNHNSLLCFLIDVLGKIPLSPIRSLLTSYYNPAHVVIFSPQSLSSLIEISSFKTISTGKNNPILDRLELSLALKLVIKSIGLISQLLGVQSRVWVLAAPRT